MATIGCVQCGRPLGERMRTFVPAPSRILLVLGATLAELVCGASIALAIAWCAARLEISVVAIAWAAASLVGLLAGARAYRGGVVSLIVAAVVLAASGCVCLLASDRTLEVLRVARVAPGLVDEGPTVLLAAGITSLAAAVLCACALPQTRRFASWQLDRLERAIRARRL